MDDISLGDNAESLSLIEIDSYRSPEERSRSGKSGDITYLLKYHRSDDIKTIKGKVVEIGKLTNSNHMDLQPLSKEGYSHYGIFRVEDRSTTTLIQDENGSIFKTFSFSRNDVKISHPVSILMIADD
jgi:hypothetical protein